MNIVPLSESDIKALQEVVNDKLRHLRMQITAAGPFNTDDLDKQFSIYANLEVVLETARKGLFNNEYQWIPEDEREEQDE